MKKKKTILIAYDSMMMGGTTTALLSLLSSIDKSLYEVSLILYLNDGPFIGAIPDDVDLLPQAYAESPLLSSSKQKILRTIVNGSVFKAIATYFRYRNTPKGNMRTILMHYGMRAQVSLSRAVEECYDIAIGFMEGWSDEYVSSTKVKAKKKFVWIHPQYDKCYLVPEIDRKIFSRVDGIALVSEDCCEPFNTVFPEYADKVRVVPNIISSDAIVRRSLEETVEIKRSAINICTVARCDVGVKGLDRLVEAMSRLRADGLLDGFTWHYIGDGRDFELLKSNIEQNELCNNVVLYGSKSNPLPYLRQMDGFLLPSRYEGKPIAVTEAQILGIPCLVTDYESASSQVADGFNGTVMPNSSDGVYRAMKKVLSNPSVLQCWRKNTELAHFGTEKEIGAFYDLIN